MMATCLELAGADYPVEFNGNRIEALAAIWNARWGRPKTSQERR